MQAVMTRMTRKYLSSLFIYFSACGSLLCHCAPNSEGDFEAYLSRTKIAESDGAKDGATGTFDVASGDSQQTQALPTPLEKRRYFVTCLTTLAPDPKKALKFAVTLDYAPKNASAEASASFVFQPLLVSATRFSASEEIGQAIVLPTAAVGADGAYVATSKKQLFIAGSANPISGSQIELAELAVNGHLRSEVSFCQKFSVDMDKPLNTQVDANCLYFTLEEGAPLPSLSKSQYDECVE